MNPWYTKWKHVARLAKEGNVNAAVQFVDDVFCPRNETPLEDTQHVQSFSLKITSRFLIVGIGYLIPATGCTYGCYSPEPNCPAIFISWYDAIVFSWWARWDGQSCRLPLEHEWEYAAKSGREWDWHYWWDRTRFDARYCNADNEIGAATPPSRERTSAWGLADILGNVWEWCDNVYRSQYSRADEFVGSKAPADEPRAVRGGSWNNFECMALLVPLRSRPVSLASWCGLSPCPRRCVATKRTSSRPQSRLDEEN